MDRNQRMAFLLIIALIACALGTRSLVAQDGPRSVSPDVSVPKAISNGFSQQPPAAVPYDAVPYDAVPYDPEASQRYQMSRHSAPVSDPDAQGADSFAGQAPTPLKRRSNSDSSIEHDPTGSTGGSSSAGAVLATMVVLLLFALGLARLFLKRSPYSTNGLPTEAVDVLGRRVVDPRTSIYMIKVGSRMILLGSSPGGLSSLAEITDPIEVASLANICAASRRSGPVAVKWLSKLWTGRTSAAESRSFDDQLGGQLFEEAQRGESARVDSLTVDINRERHRAG